MAAKRMAVKIIQDNQGHYYFLHSDNARITAITNIDWIKGLFEVRDEDIIRDYKKPKCDIKNID